MSTVAYTAIYGEYDQLKPHVDHGGIDRWLCYTDNPGVQSDTWDIVYAPPLFRHPRLSAKWWKCHPPLADRSIWLDGSMRVKSAKFFDVMLEKLEDADIALFAHPCRTSIIAEAEASVPMTKYAGLPVCDQAQFYIDEWGWQDGELWASTTLGRNHTPAVLQMGAAWFAENEHWTYQDQLSLPPMIRRYGLEPAALPHSLWRNPWFTLCGHGSAL